MRPILALYSSIQHHQFKDNTINTISQNLNLITNHKFSSHSTKMTTDLLISQETVQKSSEIGEKRQRDSEPTELANKRQQLDSNEADEVIEEEFGTIAQPATTTTEDEHSVEEIAISSDDESDCSSDDSEGQPEERGFTLMNLLAETGSRTHDCKRITVGLQNDDLHQARVAGNTIDFSEKIPLDYCMRRRTANLERLSEWELEDGSKHYMCIACNEDFKSMADLKTHLEGDVHGAFYHFRCIHCHRKFLTYSSVVDHLRKKH